MSEKVVLKTEKEIEVRFSELDPLGIVWHGNYIRYFEDGREDFGAKHNIAYPELKKNGLIAPVVSVQCNYKKYIKYGDKLVIETRYVPTPAAKMILNYTICRTNPREVVAEGNSVQVFTDLDGELQLITPEFITAWKKTWRVGK